MPNTEASKHQRVDTSLLFDSDQKSLGSDDESNLDQETDTADSSRDHVLSVIVHLSIQYNTLIVQY